MFKPIIILIGAALSSSALAVTSTNEHFIAGLSAGPTWVTGNETQTINLQPDVVKTYTASNQGVGFPSVELFLAWQRAWFISSINQPLLSQLGLSIVGAGNAKLSGNIWEDANPAFNNFNYSYQVNHVHFAAKGRVIGYRNRFVEPYVSASVGIGFNHAYNFTIDAKTSSETAAPPFQPNTTTTFSYTLGIGLQKELNPQLQAAIGYEFADWGQIQLARATGQTVGQGLGLNHLYASQLQFSLFYTVF